MADDRERRTELARHFGSHFAGIGAVRVRRNILDTPRERPAQKQRLRLREIRCRDANANADDIGERTRALGNGLQQRRVLREPPMHLPIADHPLHSLFSHVSLVVKPMR
jgi:hypothetical protein